MKVASEVNASVATEAPHKLPTEVPHPMPAAEDAFPRSFGQQRLWFLDQMEPGSPLYNIPYLVRLRGRLEETPMRRALETLVQRHESLRTTFHMVGSQPAQVIAASFGFELPLTDLSGVAESQREIELQRLARNEATRPFDLQRDL